MSSEKPLSSEQLLPVVYDQLRKLAAARLASQREAQTLQPTALVHDVWLRLGGGGKAWTDQAHFYRAASLAMRCILIDRARQNSTRKSAGFSLRLDIGDLDMQSVSPDDRLLLVDESLQRLEREDPDAAEIVMLKFFAGLTNKEAARTLGISDATVERRWAFAKVCLFQIMCELQDSKTSGA